ncbi:MAG TPA: thiamine phosphate synthase [Vicinamibacterales bacterium]|nr:thiamine phosphate synthase [Vicinamibacterales bacterium]
MLPRLYAVCDAEVCARAGWTLADCAAACVDGGATLLQLRAKHLGSRDFLAAASAVVARAGTGRAQVVINDRADIARLAGAAGVHVGQDDLAPVDVRTVVGAAATVGLSTHTLAQLDAAMGEPVNYVAVGPVFTTTTKDTGYEAAGLDLVREAAGRAAPRSLPVVAIGGITLERCADVIAAGAASVAVINDLFVTNDPAARVRAFLDRLSRV